MPRTRKDKQPDKIHTPEPVGKQDGRLPGAEPVGRQDGRVPEAETREEEVGVEAQTPETLLPEPLSAGEEEQLPPRQLVVVGSSAGGVQALLAFVATLPAEFPAPLVLAQHLDPERASNLGSILQRRTALPVVTVGSSTRLMPGTIYVVPANRHVFISDGHVEVQIDHSNRPRPSIDLLMTSAARAYGEHLVAVILTGSGADGASGAIEVKRAGGIVVIQNPQTAQFPSMPLSLPPTAVDYVVDVQDLGRLLVDLLVQPAVASSVPVADNAPQEILGQVSRQANIDFRHYKPSTILRRIGRRMAITRNASVSDYAEYLRQQPGEVTELVKAFLIKVTEFFRDPDAFTYLQTQVLPDLIEQGRRRDNSLRLWSAGSATGEEPYSLALLLASMLGQELSQWNIKIFATDLDEDAISFARRGIYPDNVLRQLPPELRSRFFEHADHGYRISKTIRQMVIFGQQDLSKGVPFPRIDLVTCRNLLIYFKPELQQQVLDKFAYSLGGGKGYLFLGPAETVRPSQTIYEIVSKRWKIYRCMQATHGLGWEPGDLGVSPTVKRPFTRPVELALKIPNNTDMPLHESELSQLRRFNELVLRSLPTGIVLVDRAYNIVSINSAARRLLEIREAGVGQDFLHTARTLPYNLVRSAIDSAFRERTPATLGEINVANGPSAEARCLSLSLLPMDSESAGIELLMINVEDVTEMVTTRHHLETLETEQRELLSELQVSNRRLTDLNKDLQDANEELQAANEELMLAQEELQATNEEFEATNEELQATNEELETNNEELQATNEELETTNQEFQARTAELQEMTRTLAAERVRLAEMVEMAPFFILVLRGPALRVEAFNPRFSHVFPGRDVLGQPAEMVFTEPETELLLAKLHLAYSTDKPQVDINMLTRVLGDEGWEERYFNYNIVPIHDPSGAVDGVVVYAEDVTGQLQRESSRGREKLKLLVENADQVALGLYDARTCELLQASPAYVDFITRMHGYPSDDVIGRPWREVAFTQSPDEADSIFDSVVSARGSRRFSQVHLRVPGEGMEMVWDYTLTPIAFDDGDSHDGDGGDEVRFVALSAIEVTG